MKTTTLLPERLFPFILFLAILPCLVGVLGCYAQAPAIDWSYAYGGSAADNGHDIIQTADGGYIIAGTSKSSNGDVSGNYGDEDIWIVKLQANGSIEWEKNYGGSFLDRAYSIIQTSTGGYIVAGLSYSSDGDISNNYGSGDALIIALDANGNILWEKNYGGSNYDFFTSVKQTADGGLIAAGITFSNDGDVSNNYGNGDLWVVRLTDSGTIIWEKSLGGSDQDEAYDISQTADGGFVVVGFARSSDWDVSGNHGQHDVWIVKLNSSGELVWEKNYGGSGQDWGWAIQQTADGGYILACHSISTDGDVTLNLGGYDVWVLKLNASGNMEWQKSYGGSINDYGYSVRQTNDGGYIIAGKSNSNDGDVGENYGNFDAWVIKLNASGVLLWEKNYGGSSYDEINSIKQTTDGGFILLGYSNSSNGDLPGNSGSNDVWVMKLQPDPLSIEGVLVNKISIYPNPTSNLIYIETTNTIENIQVFDILGKQISLSQSISDINSTKKLDLEQVKSGVYVIAITTIIQTYMFKIMKK